MKKAVLLTFVFISAAFAAHPALAKERPKAGTFYIEMDKGPDTNAPLPLAAGDFTFIQKDGINLRSAAGTANTPILSLNKGTGFVVLARQGEWLFGEVFRRNGLEGWVHEKFLDTTFPAGARVPTTAAFLEMKNFMQELDNESRARTGVSRYVDILNWGDGVAAVIVNQNWMADDYGAKKTNFNRINEMWTFLDGNRQEEKLFVLSPSNFILMQD